MSGNRRDGQALQGRAGLHCANPDVLLGDGTVLPPSSSLPCSWAAGLTCSEPCKGHLRHLSMLIPKQSWAAAHSHPHPGCSSLLAELRMLASGKFFMYKTTGNKSSVSGIFLIIFWNFTLSFLQVLFQSSSTKKVVWGSIYLYFRSSYCPGIKHFEFYIGHKKAKVSSWEIALKIKRTSCGIVWDHFICCSWLYLKYLLSVWNAFVTHWHQQCRLAGQLGRHHKGIHMEKSIQSFGHLQSEYNTCAINPHLSRSVNMA